MRIATVDLISNTCFPLLAADELGLFKAEGLDVSIELLPTGVRALRNGEVDMIATGAVYQVLTEFPGWAGAKVVVALSQETPWLLVVRADLAGKQGDLSAIRGLRLSAAGGGPYHALKRMVVDAGIEPGRDFELLVDQPATRGRDVSFGVAAARDLEAGVIDGFWGNALGAETVVANGSGKILIDVRRGDDPDDVRHFSFSALATTDAYLEHHASDAKAAVRAIVQAQRMLHADPSLARKVGEGKFPLDTAELIVRTIERDVGFYDPVITGAAVASMNAFAESIGLLAGSVPYDRVVDTRFRECWS